MMRVLPLLGLALLAWARPVLADLPPAICLLERTDPDGLDSDSLRGALALEARKAGVAANVIGANGPAACPPEAALLVASRPGGTVVIHERWGAPREVDLSGVDARDRAQEAARIAVATLAVVLSGRPVIVDRAIERPAPPPPPSPRVSAAPAAYAQIGSRYEYRPGSRGHGLVLDCEGGVSLYGERLQAGVRGEWQPEFPAPGSGEVQAASTAAGIEAVVRGGFPAGRTLLRGALVVGAEWRRVVLAVPTRLDSPSRVFVQPVMGAEVDAVVPLHRLVRLSVFASVRVWPRARGLAWLGDVAWEPFRVGVGAGVRLGFLLPGGR
jgi:hypothetical protein